MSQANSQNTTPSSLSTNRRALLTTVCGAVAAAVVDMPAVAATVPDPIYAAIEEHKAAHIAFSSAVAVSGVLFPDHPDYQLANAAAAGDAAMQTAIDITAIVPTTIAGVVALLGYIDAFNRGEIVAGSEHHLWPSELMDDDILTVKGYALEMPWPFWIMRNVQAALQRISAQS
jgi:hypothetical protein